MKQARPLSESTIRFALFLVRIVPRWLGYPLADISGWLYGQLAHEYRAIVESNLEAVLPAASRRQRRAVAARAFATAARAYYELLYMPSVPPKKIARLAHFDEPGWTDFQQAQQEGRGVVIAAPHLSSFDLLGQVLVARGYPIFVLALPDPSPAFVYMNKMRAFQQRGEIAPTGTAALLKAVRVLREGGIVGTGADRPIRGQGTVVQFFGRPTLLPDGHIRLALRTGAALFLTPCRREHGQYHLGFQRIALERSGDEETDIQATLQRFAQAMEPAIRSHPEQWHLLIRLWE